MSLAVPIALPASQERAPQRPQAFLCPSNGLQASPGRPLVAAQEMTDDPMAAGVLLVLLCSGAVGD